ncbi:MAG TPA: M28 family peptidase [Tissierellaceae bacterium]
MDYLKTIKDTIIKKYGIRFFPRQKEKFREYIKDEMEKLGWDTEIIKKNIVVGDVEKAEYVFTAHYDTPGKIPNFLRYLLEIFGHLKQIQAIIVFFIMYYIYRFAITKLVDLNIIPIFVSDLLQILPALVIIIAIFIPNRSNYNDNTSGVLTLLNIAHEISMKNLDKEKIAYIFFNNEEWGLLGSAAMKKHFKKKKIDISKKKVINFDCVGNGDTILITHGKKEDLAKEIQERLKISSPCNVERFKYKIIPLSDDYTFRKDGVIGILYCKRTKLGGFYFPDIHCSKDKVVNIENIEFLTNEIINYIVRKKEVIR